MSSIYRYRLQVVWYGVRGTQLFDREAAALLRVERRAPGSAGMVSFCSPEEARAAVRWLEARAHAPLRLRV